MPGQNSIEIEGNHFEGGILHLLQLILDHGQGLAVFQLPDLSLLHSLQLLPDNLHRFFIIGNFNTGLDGQNPFMPIQTG
ncbi:hypothetical protein D3C75_701350 [compost metagenome]